MRQAIWTRARFLISILATAVVLLALTPGVVQAGGCGNNRCPTGEDDDDEESKVQVRITIMVEPEAAGTVEIDGDELEGDSFYLIQGESVRLEADPERGYEFVRWSGSITSTKNPLETPFYNNKSITAHFAAEQEPDEQSAPALEVMIPEGTDALDQGGSQVSEVSVRIRSAHNTPANMTIVSSVFDLGPEGATFDPALPLALPYDEDVLPNDVEPSELVLAWFDEETAKWVSLDSTVDEDEGVVKALVDHFTDFCILAPVEDSAMVATVPNGTTPGMSLSGLDVSPVEPRIGEAVTISVIASYGGEEAVGTATVALEVDGGLVETRGISVPAGGTQVIAFTYTPGSDSVHTVTVNGLQGVFEVAPAVAPAALTEAVALAESDSFSLPALPDLSLPALPKVSGFSFAAHWWRIALAALVAVTLLVTLPLVRRRIARYRYDI